MTTINTELTAADVAARVRPYVEKMTVGDITLRLDEAGIALSNNYWRIPVHPSQEPKHLFRYLEALADLEQEIQDKEGIKVTISDSEPLYSLE